MEFVNIVVVIALAGMFVWAVTYLFGDKMPEIFKRAIYVVCVVFIVCYILSTFGLLTGIPNHLLKK